MGVVDGRRVLLLIGMDAAVESRDDAMAAGVIVRRELLVEAPIGNTGTCDKDANGMLTETPVLKGTIALMVGMRNVKNMTQTVEPSASQ